MDQVNKQDWFDNYDTFGIGEHPAVIVEGVNINNWNEGFKTGASFDAMVTSFLSTVDAKANKYFGRMYRFGLALARIPTVRMTTGQFLKTSKKTNPDRAHGHAQNIIRDPKVAQITSDGNKKQPSFTQEEFNTLLQNPNLTLITSLGDRQVSAVETFKALEKNTSVFTGKNGDHYFSRTLEGWGVVLDLVSLNLLNTNIESINSLLGLKQKHTTSFEAYCEEHSLFAKKMEYIQKLLPYLYRHNK